MDLLRQRKWLGLLTVLLSLILTAAVWFYFKQAATDETVICRNGRIEAVEIDVSAKSPGRLATILVNEGQFVVAGQVLAQMDTKALQAERLQAEALLKQAAESVVTAESQLALRESERKSALAVVNLRQTELTLAEKRSKRIIQLATSGHTSAQSVDDANAAVDSAKAALNAATAQVAATAAAIATAYAQIDSAKSSVAAAQAGITRIQVDIDDSDLKAPVNGRIQYIVSRPGEVIGAGGSILNLVDVTDVFMTFFLPTAYAGRLAIGTEARLVLDAAPTYVIPAHISFIADVAQFTPKTVETDNEREKLMFRIRAKIAPALLVKHIKQVKTGLPGEACLRIAEDQPWPSRLQQNLVR
ncbi:HlyD family efflux transporter periplasmic adaptor subunit [Shewanella yunxiaonensis]|uniref:HlyD family efflux transporter periplasmic adaptor subunit n=1 Tax=Shewanella yunxiaonensis TaxID=2829809 RepID=A0ABX7YSN9_9GAMM|nr:HlyD family efflux transporter periplasmic adaptor subunit [Shewanella yunxiaonensis]QUN05742.1 HlyD family efflux transporter periplasmic adaptor subunit [Shewanella yunxiaonensis]